MSARHDVAARLLEEHTCRRRTRGARQIGGGAPGAEAQPAIARRRPAAIRGAADGYRDDVLFRGLGSRGQHRRPLLAVDHLPEPACRAEIRPVPAVDSPRPWCRGTSSSARSTGAPRASTPVAARLSRSCGRGNRDELVRRHQDSGRPLVSPRRSCRTVRVLAPSGEAQSVRLARSKALLSGRDNRTRRRRRPARGRSRGRRGGRAHHALAPAQARITTRLVTAYLTDSGRRAAQSEGTATLGGGPSA